MAPPTLNDVLGGRRELLEMSPIPAVEGRHIVIRRTREPTHGPAGLRCRPMPPLEVTLRQDSATSSIASIRSHEVTIDRPGPAGGGDAGPMGGELLLASIGGCFLSTLYAAAIARDVDLAGTKCTVAGEMAEDPKRFTSVAITVANPGHEPASFDHLVLIAERGCLVIASLRPALAITVKANPA